MEKAGIMSKFAVDMKGILASPYRRGADNGLVMGVYLSIMFGCISQSIYNVTPGDAATGSAASLWGMVLLLLLPAALYVMLRRGYVKDGGMSTFSKLWLEGIMTFLFGGLIAIAVGYAYMHFVNPSFMNDMYDTALRMINLASTDANDATATEYKQVADIFERMRENGELPSVPTFLFNLLWYITFMGSLLSMAVAALARIARVKQAE